LYRKAKSKILLKIIVLWEAGELIELLYNFMRFHIIKVLHPDKDDLAYAKDGCKCGMSIWVVIHIRHHYANNYHIQVNFQLNISSRTNN
jgi:hypothetical protein